MKTAKCQAFLLYFALSFGSCQGFAGVLSSSSPRSQSLQPLRLGFMDYTQLSPLTFDDIQVEGVQIARDKEYLDSTLKQWNTEERPFPVEAKTFEYKDDEKANMFGHLVRRTPSAGDPPDKSLPGILLFHTQNGPKDISLFHQADRLVQNFNCVVLICDVLSDAYGWAWGESRTQYLEMRDSLMANDGELLRARAATAANAICCVPEVDPHRLAALGWSLGGQAILELGRIQSAAFSIQAMVTFHGVFRREAPAAAVLESPTGTGGGSMLICNGKDDPLVQEQDLMNAQKILEGNEWEVVLLQYEGAKHSFSFPAQDFTDDPWFAYNEEAAEKSWEAALQLLEEKLC